MSSLHTPAAIRRILSLHAPAPSIRRSLSLRTPAPIRRSLSLHASAPPFRGSLSIHAPVALAPPTTMSDETDGSDPGEAKDGVYEKEKNSDGEKGKTDGDRGRKGTDGKKSGGGGGGRKAGKKAGKKQNGGDDLTLEGKSRSGGGEDVKMEVSYKIECSYYFNQDTSGRKGTLPKAEGGKIEEKLKKALEILKTDFWKVLQRVAATALFVFACRALGKPGEEVRVATITKVMSAYGDLVQKINLVQKGGIGSSTDTE